MSTATTPTTAADLTPLEVPGPVTRVPSRERLRELTTTPDRRVVFRGVGWSFYEKPVDSVPEGANLHVDFDGKDLEIMAIGPDHDDVKFLLAENSVGARSRLIQAEGSLAIRSFKSLIAASFEEEGSTSDSSSSSENS